MANVKLFRRGDGVEFAAEVGSESYKQMINDGSFVCMDPDNEIAPDKQAEPAAKKSAAKKATAKAKQADGKNNDK